MPDIRTTTEEFAASGSLANVQKELQDEFKAAESQEVCQFLSKKNRRTHPRSKYS